MSVAEQWRAIRGFEGMYEVSNLGRVKSLAREVWVKASPAFRAPKADYLRRSREIILKAACRRDGYLKVNLYREGESCQPPVHRLVCEAFHGPPPVGYDAAHNDGEKHNNVADNLRWATRADNLADRIDHGTHQRGERAYGAKLTSEDVIAIRSALVRGERQSALARRFEVSPSTIHLIAAGRNWAWLTGQGAAPS